MTWQRAGVGWVGAELTNPIKSLPMCSESREMFVEISNPECQSPAVQNTQCFGPWVAQHETPVGLGS